MRRSHQRLDRRRGGSLSDPSFPSSDTELGEVKRPESFPQKPFHEENVDSDALRLELAVCQRLESGDTSDSHRPGDDLLETNSVTFEEEEEEPDLMQQNWMSDVTDQLLF